MKYLLLALILLTLTGCADAVPIDPTTVTVGFWHGLWHGIILLFSFIISLFDNDVAIYAVNNSGGWYDFGFLCGVSMTGISYTAKGGKK